MIKPEYDRFRYNTLSNLEPGLLGDHDWVVNSGVKSISVIADNAIEEATDEEEENNICPDCGCDTTDKPCDC